MGGFKPGRDDLTDLTVDGGIISVRTDAAYPSPAIRANGPVIGTFALNIVDTDANHTITVAQLINAGLARSANGALSAIRTDITPSAAQIVAAIPGCVVAQRFNFKYCNFDTDTGGGNGAHNIVLDLGAGVTNHASDGTATYAITPGQARNFLFRVTNVGASSEAVTILADGAAYALS